MAKKNKEAKKVNVPEFDLTTTEGQRKAMRWVTEELARLQWNRFENLDQRLRRVERHLGIHGDESADLH